MFGFLAFPLFQPFLNTFSGGFVKFYLASFLMVVRLLWQVIKLIFRLNQVVTAITFLCQWLSMKVIRLYPPPKREEGEEVKEGEGFAC